MTYIQYYSSPLGGILLAADEGGLTGLWFVGGRYFADRLPAEHTEKEVSILSEAVCWLDVTVTYGELSNRLAKERGLERMSAQAVGGAVAHNPISIMIPCHRVVGANGSLTGYAGGMEKKIQLLTLEHCDTSRLFVPKKGTAR